MRSRIDRRDASGATRRPMIPQPARSATWRRVPDRRPGSAVDDVQVARRFVERDRAIRAADHDVLDAGPVLAHEVDPGLDREGHPFAERLAVAGDDVGVLVAFETDPVAG